MKKDFLSKLSLLTVRTNLNLNRSLEELKIATEESRLGPEQKGCNTHLVSVLEDLLIRRGR